MTLKLQQTVRAIIGNHDLTVIKKLGEGGQGEVYLVAGPQGQMALKWYHAHQSTPAQEKSIRELVQEGPPRKMPEAAKRFVWPQDLVTAADRTQFGYLMPLIDVACYTEMGEVQARRKPQPTPQVLCEIGYQLANSYRALHLAGYCYRDLNQGNMMFDPKTGDVLICDNDNIGVNNQSTGQILGTWEFMAPEVILGKAAPSTASDLHSLAVLLFNLWMWHHPFHGDMECAIRSWDLPAKKRIYGEQPVFIYDPAKPANRPNDPDYGTVRKRWNFCPPLLQQLFIKAFTDGLREPGRRVTEGEWQRGFLQLKEGALTCPHCGAENLWDPTVTALACWHCKKPVPIPGRLAVHLPTGRFHLLLTPGMKLRAYHLDPSQGAEGTRAEVLGELVQNPNNPAQWGIRNLTATPWTIEFSDGSRKDVPPQRSAPLSAGARMQVNGRELEILA